MIDYATLNHTDDGMPTWDSFLPIALQVASTKSSWSSLKLKDQILEQVDLPEELRDQTYENGRNVVTQRVSFALSALKNAGLLESPQRSHYQITKLGRQMLDTYGMRLNKMVVQQLPQFIQHQKQVMSDYEQTKEQQVQQDQPVVQPQQLSEETVADWFGEQTDQMKARLLEQMSKINHYRFEHLIVSLFEAMGYKGENGKVVVTQRAKDNGIDGILSQDPLGLQKVYIQVKHHSASDVVEQHYILEFNSAMQVHHASRGIFVTTSSFSSGAISNAERLGIVLVDGDQLTDLMLRYRVGVNVQRHFELYNLDPEFFANFEDAEENDD